LIAFDLPPLRLEIADGDIAAEAADAVVNAANNHFWMGAGVAGALKARGGASIESEAMAQGPVEPGECVLTSGDRATRNALRMADANHLGSITMPAFGTGVGGFPIDECARIMIGAIRAEAPSLAAVRLVRLVLFGMPAYRRAAEVAGEMLGKPLDGPDDCVVSG